MKKKISMGLVFALILALMATAAYAVSAILRAPEADAVTRGRQAIMDKYSLPPETMGLFFAQASERDGVWTITLYGNEAVPEKLLGEYTAIVQGDDITAAWSHDDVDKALWEDGAFSAPVWGGRQLAAYLKDQEAASPYIMAAGFDVKPQQTPAPLQPGEHHWRDEIVTDAAPGEQDLTMAQALDIAKAALIEEFGFAKEDFEDGRFSYMDDPDFYQRADGSRIWLFSLNAMRQGVECGCGVAVDAATGEIVFSQIITGGNG